MVWHHWLPRLDINQVVGLDLVQILGLKKECKLVWTYLGVPL